MKLKEKNRRLKIMISCGGWGQAGQFEGIVGSEEARKEFSQNVITFCRQWGFDGIDLGILSTKKLKNKHKILLLRLGISYIGTQRKIWSFS